MASRIMGDITIDQDIMPSDAPWQPVWRRIGNMTVPVHGSALMLVQDTHLTGGDAIHFVRESTLRFIKSSWLCLTYRRRSCQWPLCRPSSLLVMPHRKGLLSSAVTGFFFFWNRQSFCHWTHSCASSPMMRWNARKWSGSPWLTRRHQTLSPREYLLIPTKDAYDHHGSVEDG